MKTRKRTSSIFITLFMAVMITAGINIKQAKACGGNDSYLATMCVFAGNFAPRGYAFAQGQLLPISSNTALFSLLGTIYGGDGRTTFALPDTRGRALIGAGRGPGLSNYPLGHKGGVETVTLSVNQMPSHSHAASTTVSGDATLHASSAGNSDNPANNVLARKPRDSIYSSNAPDVSMSTSAISLALTGNTSVGNTGGSRAHENRMPYISVNWIITIQGVFPSRS